VFGIGIAAFGGMTWLEMANLLDDRSKSLSPKGAHLHPNTAEWFRTWTPHQNQSAEAAARQFAATWEWPPVHEDVAIQLYFRCLFAIESCIGSNVPRGSLASCPKTDQERLEFLLVTAWSLSGLEWAERRYAAPSKPLRVRRL
jgi:hypothetical protein